MIAFLVAAAVVQAAPAEPKVDCAEPQNTIKVNECGAEALSRDREQMGRYLEAALTKVSKDLEEGDNRESGGWTEEVVASQQAFEDYADKACQAVYTLWQSGTIRNIRALECQRRLVLDRTHHLWREYLTFMDSTEPVLPEPRPFEWPKPAAEPTVSAPGASASPEPKDTQP